MKRSKLIHGKVKSTCIDQNTLKGEQPRVTLLDLPDETLTEIINRTNTETHLLTLLMMVFVNKKFSSLLSVCFPSNSSY